VTGHIVVIHRWRDSHARYERYLDHSRNNVTYVSTELALPAIPAAAAGTELVAATDDFDEVREATERLVSRFGPPTRLIALNEGDLDTAAQLRAYLGCPGQDPVKLAPFRDKLTMAERVAAAGIRMPAFADAPDPDAVLKFANEHGWPVVVKPRRGTASRGVLVLDSPEDLTALYHLPPEARLVQKYCPDQIYHVDGLWTGTMLGPWRASRYLNTCVDFTAGAVLGSIEEDDPQLCRLLGEFTATVAAALSDEPWVFHIEVFVHSTDDGVGSFTFLEAGYRVGGAEIPFIWREVHGIDLMAAAVDVQMGRQPELPPDNRRRVGGWLLVPTPVAPPCRVVNVDLPDWGENGPYAQVLPPVGYQVPRVGGYEHVGARFRFQAATSADVKRSICDTASRFRLECVPEVVQDRSGACD
jgi:biotin carboxylase